MKKKKYEVLTEAEVEHFISKGYVLVKDCISREVIQEKVDAAWKRLDEDPKDPSTWKRQRVHLPTTSSVRVSDISPKAWGAICDLLGGRERIEREEQRSWPDSFMVLFKRVDTGSWSSPIDDPENPGNYGGWHKDHPGSGVKHYLDSRQMGLNTYVYWNDVKPRGGGLFVSLDSVGEIARHLKDAPDGFEHEKLNVQSLLGKTQNMMELTANAGDVFLVHPFMIHSESQNDCADPRFLIATMIPLVDRLNLDRKDGGYSPVERVILKALGVDKFPFRRTEDPPHAPAAAAKKPARNRKDN